MLELPNACRRGSKQKQGRDREGTEVSQCTDNFNRPRRRTANMANECQFPPVVRPRFRGCGLRFAAAEDWSALEVVGDAVSPPPPLRFSGGCVEGVDDAGAEAAGLGA
jgi:hypothetical protein